MSMPSSTPDVQIIIPTYNRAAFIAEAVDSVLLQAEDGIVLEVIVVDDGSTDDTAQVMERFAGKAVRYVHQENAGGTAARNAGLALAEAPWVAYLDSDDIWLPGKLALQLKEVAKHPDAVAHFTNVIMDRPGIGESDLVTMRRLDHLFEAGSPYVVERPLLFNLEHNYGRFQTILARRDVLTRMGGCDPNVRVFQDTDMMNRLARGGGHWLLSNEILVHEMRREEAHVAIGADRLKNKEKGYQSLCDQMEKITAKEDIAADERALAAQKRDFYAVLTAEAWLRKGNVDAARKALGQSGGQALQRKALKLKALMLPGAGPLRRRLMQTAR